MILPRLERFLKMTGDLKRDGSLLQVADLRSGARLCKAQQIDRFNDLGIPL